MFGPLVKGDAAPAQLPVTEADAAEEAAEDNEDEEDEAEAADNKPGMSCIAGQLGAATSNQTLLQWLPKCDRVAALWAATDDQKNSSSD